MVSLFNDNQFSLVFNTKANLAEEQQWNYVRHSWMDRRVHTFSSDIISKSEQLGFELAYLEAAIQHFNHYAMRTIITFYL